MERIKYIIQCVYTVFKFIENCFIIPFKKLLAFCEPITKRYKELWKKVVYDKYGDFLYKRAILMIFYTISAIYFLFVIIGFTFDIVYYKCTKRVETIYLSDSVELDSESNIWGVKGCPTLNCDSNTALYFRIKTSWFNQFWNIYHNKHLFYSDIIAAAVPTGQAKCEVISYGLRYRVLMMYNYYPQILHVNCQPLE